MQDSGKRKIFQRETEFSASYTQEAGFAKIYARDAGFFPCMLWNSGNHTFEQQMKKCCLPSNQAIECALLFIYYFFCLLVLISLFSETKKEFGKAMKISGMGDFREKDAGIRPLSIVLQ